MNGNLDDLGIKRHSSELDLTQVLLDWRRGKGKLDEKYLLARLLTFLSSHEVKLTRILSAAFPELAKTLPDFFQKRLEDHRGSLRAQKIVAFWTWAAIEREAVSRALEDTEAMVRQVSVMGEDNLGELINSHREILRRLCDTLVELLQEQSDMSKDLDNIQKMLGGGGK